MYDRHPSTHMDAFTARSIQSRNIRNSQAIIRGEFETALADIIEQIENPASDPNDKPVAIPDLVRRIARALTLGLAGLHPNGFEFCLWMWEVAPLHGVNLRLRNHRTVNGIPLGVVYLRRITSLVLHLYVTQQSEKTEMLYELLDSSSCRMDAHDLIYNALAGDLIENFDSLRSMLDDFASSAVPWRVLLALSVSELIVERYPEKTEAALSLISLAFHIAEHPAVLKGIRDALLAVSHYGDQEIVAQFITMNLRRKSSTCAVICENLLLPRIRRDEQFRNRMTPILDHFIPADETDCFIKVLEAVSIHESAVEV